MQIITNTDMITIRRQIDTNPDLTKEVLLIVTSEDHFTGKPKNLQYLFDLDSVNVLQAVVNAMREVLNAMPDAPGIPPEKIREWEMQDNAGAI